MTVFRLGVEPVSLDEDELVLTVDRVCVDWVYFIVGLIFSLVLKLELLSMDE